MRSEVPRNEGDYSKRRGGRKAVIRGIAARAKRRKALAEKRLAPLANRVGMAGRRRPASTTLVYGESIGESVAKSGSNVEIWQRINKYGRHHHRIDRLD